MSLAAPPGSNLLCYAQSTVFCCDSCFSHSLCTCSLFNHTPPTEIYTLSLHDALPIYRRSAGHRHGRVHGDCGHRQTVQARSEEHTSELQSLRHLVCRLLLEKKNQKQQTHSAERESLIDAVSTSVNENTAKSPSISRRA